MIQLIGIKHNVDVETREKLSIITSRVEEALKNIIKECDEAVVLSTCNRTEIYFSSDEYDEQKIYKIFRALGWDVSLIDYIFHIKGIKVAKHLMEVICGYHSRIVGEDQILGQIKNAYDISKKNKAVKNELQRLFQMALTCGKEFRVKSELYKFPVSSSSIVVRQARKRNVKRFMILGFGEVGQLTTKYILDGDFDILYIAVRNKDKVLLNNEKVRVIDFSERIDVYRDVECIISCTSSPHYVIKAEELPDKELIIFDLAVPRDVEECVGCLENIELYGIDRVSMLHDESHLKRKELMKENKHIVEEHIKKYENWLKIREISCNIKNIRESGESVYKDRLKTFKNKYDSKNHKVLAETMLKSTSNYFINRAIEVLKEEHLEGRGEECLKILNKIFMMEQ
ncbi:glutamyl-tRNA reductase [Fervidicella metallireducens AeB]|uniref:Glutamyl-tRNA reductase n=1 Tax=Fervidicella metallireducens AeB TaxID=1403537 RepID=A0A017RX18_9CLOT|nr:glutamyl-tRNA reductase [Fervidicella metallireducens]EYE89232.1 glutamyl-tRNA reductase [Fervidicella metallireducens AeB]